MRAERTDRNYKLEPLDTSGVFLGLGVVQCGLLGAGIVLGVGALTVGAPLPVAAVPVVVSVAVSFTRISGHASWEWLPLLVGWLAARVRRGRRWQAPLPLWTDGDDPRRCHRASTASTSSTSTGGLEAASVPSATVTAEPSPR